MAIMKRPRLQAVQALTDYRLRLTFIDGSVAIVSLADDFEKFPGLKPLHSPDVFATATLIDDEGWTVEWPSVDIQIGAETLWLDVQAQNAPDENTRVFAKWRARHGLSLKRAAEAIGMTPRTMSAYGTGTRPVPRYVALACKGWEAEHHQESIRT